MQPVPYPHCRYKLICTYGKCMKRECTHESDLPESWDQFGDASVCVIFRGDIILPAVSAAA